MLSTETIYPICNTLGNLLVARGQTVCTVESCTGGGIGYAITAVSGSSAWYQRGFITYSNQAKSEMVNVPETVLVTYGAVSLEVAECMATGARNMSNSDYAISVTGVAGPEGGSKEKPVGTVCFGWAGPDGVRSEKMHFQGDRDAIRTQSIFHGLNRLIEKLVEPA